MSRRKGNKKGDIKFMVLNQSGELEETTDPIQDPIETINETEEPAEELTEEQEAWDVEMKRLWKYNKVNGSIHLVQGLLQFYLSFTNDRIS
jgi:hypothetical protein